MSKTGGQLDTKLVELGDDFSLVVPMDWTCAWLDDGRWQCGDRDGIFQCYFRHEIAPPTDPPAYPLNHAQRCLDIMRRWLEELGTIGGIDERRTISGGIVHGITEALINEGLGLRDLRLDGPVVVSVPATWSVRQIEDGILAQGPDGVPQLVARVGHDDDDAVLRAISEAGPAQNFSEMAEVGFRAAIALARTLAVVVSSIDRAEYGAIIAGELDAPGAADQRLVWYYVIPTRTRCIIAGLELAIPLELRDRPDMVEAKSMVAREIAKLRLEFDDDNDDDD